MNLRPTYGIFMFESTKLSFNTLGEGHFKHWVLQMPRNGPVSVRFSLSPWEK